MKLTKTAIPEVVILEPTIFKDDRGFFFESYNDESFRSALSELDLNAPGPFVQDNHSCSNKGVLRGLHFQSAPYSQGKLVRVVQGSVFDVAVDIRPESRTYGRWVGLELSAKNKKMLWIPDGFAHGFLTLEDDTHFLYKTTNFYSRDAERSIIWNDPVLNIRWPLEAVGNLIISEKDSEANRFEHLISLK